MQEADFLSVEDHFQLLLGALDSRELQAYSSLKHIRTEMAYRHRNLLVYKMDEGIPVELDRVIVNDFHTDTINGSSVELFSQTTKRTLVVGYTPTRLFEHPVFVWLPLRTRISWAASARTLSRGSLAFPLTIRTRSRFNLRENGVTYCETGKTFGTEFNETSED